MDRVPPVPGPGAAAVVTGGSSGIGHAVAQALVARGVHVALVGRTPERVHSAAAALRAHTDGKTEVLPLALDVRSADDMARMAETVLETFGRIDLLVASAGIAREPGSTRLMPSPVAQMPLSEWDAVIATNLRGVFLADRAVLPAMLRQGEGTIVNISSSPAGLQGQAYAAAYCASKFGVRGLSQSLAEEVGRHGVRVHVLFPDVVDTPMLEHTTLARRRGTPLPPQRVAELVVALWTQPADSLIVEPVLRPTPHRKRTPAERRPAAEGSD